MAGLLLTHSVLWLLARLTGASEAGLLAYPLLIAPLGASAVLIYAVPASPLAQPWSVVVGNTLSAIMALIVLRLGLPPVVALGLAALLALAAMPFARALHPPGGAVAVATVLAANPGSHAGTGLSSILTVLLASSPLAGARCGLQPRHPPGFILSARHLRLWNRSESITTRHLPLSLPQHLDRLRLGAVLRVEDLTHLIDTANDLCSQRGV